VALREVELLDGAKWGIPVPSPAPKKYLPKSSGLVKRQKSQQVNFLPIRKEGSNVCKKLKRTNHYLIGSDEIKGAFKRSLACC